MNEYEIERAIQYKKECEIEREESMAIINGCLENSNNQDLRTILDCLGEIGHDVTRPTKPIRG